MMADSEVASALLHVLMMSDAPMRWADWSRETVLVLGRDVSAFVMRLERNRLLEGNRARLVTCEGPMEYDITLKGLEALLQ